MTTLITTFALGALTSVLGVVNMMGNLSTIHWYHRKRVREEDKKPFGKLVGIGTLIIGIAIAVFGVFSYAFEQTQNAYCSILAMVVMMAGLVVGLGLSFYAMFKYNKGIF